MPFLLKIGYQKKNLSKITCKGYFISRKRNLIQIKYGGVLVKRGNKNKFFWKGPHLPLVKPKTFKNSEQAKKYFDSRINQKLNRGYTFLKEGVKIYKFNSQ